MVRKALEAVVLVVLVVLVVVLDLVVVLVVVLDLSVVLDMMRVLLAEVHPMNHQATHQALD